MTTVGYGATHRAAKGTRVATIALGYADGWLRTLSNRGFAVLNGQRIPLIGRVSMDLVIVDTGNMPDAPKAGEWLEVLGPHQDVDQLAASCGTIGYEILTSLRRSRYHRAYIASS